MIALVFLCAVIGGGLLMYWMIIGLGESPESSNHFLPARGHALSHQYGFAGGLLGITGILYFGIRTLSLRREVGGIQ